MFRNKFVTGLLAALMSCGIAAGQQSDNNKILMTIDGQKITKGEFERIYHKNNDATSVDKKSLDEYRNLFINFKLKVIEAEHQGLDTLASFRRELAGYRDQLAKPYLTNDSIDQFLIHQAYKRMKQEVDASHILIRVDKNASPEDTLRAYEKAMEIRERILNGESFEKVARAVSDDPSAKRNGGHLGYFTAFQMVYPFESAAYNTPVGEISMPVRTRFGYHLIKVNDKRPAQGEIKVAHIMIAVPEGRNSPEAKQAKTKIDEIYNKLKNGADFAEMAKKYSDDKGSASKGGDLPWFGTGRMVPEFEQAAFSLKHNGDISMPVQTDYGWHIIKRIDKKEVPSFEEAKDRIKSMIARDNRAQMGRDIKIQELKNEYNFTENKGNVADFYPLVDNSFFEGKWKASRAKGMNKVLFTLGDKKYTQQDFADYLASHSRKQKPVSANMIVDNLYTQFVNKSVLAYEKDRLPEKYPEFRYLMEEYHDGILLFDLTDKMVWSKAVKDTAGLRKFYEKNKQKYMWGKRVDATVYQANTEDQAKEARKLVKKMDRKGYSRDEIAAMVCPAADTAHSCITWKSGMYEKGDNQYADQAEWKTGVNKPQMENGTWWFINIHEVQAPGPKMLEEARGLITADYQNYLEDQWVKSLRDKYRVVINENVWDEVK